MSDVYVATRWARRAEARETMARLRAAGHHITHDWTHEDSAEGMEPAAQAEHFAACARTDVLGVTQADVLLLLHDPAARGAFVELGIALGREMRVIVVGALVEDPVNEPIFYWLPWVEHAGTVGEALALLRS